MASRLVLVFVLSVALTACSSIFDGQTQEITVLTPGAQDAHCYLENQDFKYRVITGQTIRITNSPNAMEVKCLAPGNRDKTIVVQPDIAPSAVFNIANAGAGLPYDYFSHALHKYPAVITVNFTDVPLRPYPLPKYHNADVDNPAYAEIEYFGPGVPMVEGDKYEATPVLQKYDQKASSNPFAEFSTDAESADSGATEEASSAGASTAEELTRTMNPHVFGN